MKFNLYCRQPECGFTVVELVITMAIIAILAGVALPAYQDFTKNACLTSVSSKLISSLQYARSEAIKRRIRIYVTPERVGTQKSWNYGWAVGHTVIDNSNPNTGPVARHVVFRRFDKGRCDATDIRRAGTGAVGYNPDGAMASSSTMTFYVCDDRDNQRQRSPGREIKISATGRPKTDSRYTGPGCP